MKTWQKRWTLIFSFIIGLVALAIGKGAAVVPVMTMWGVAVGSFNGAEGWGKRKE